MDSRSQSARRRTIGALIGIGTLVAATQVGGLGTPPVQAQTVVNTYDTDDIPFTTDDIIGSSAAFGGASGNRVDKDPSILSTSVTKPGDESTTLLGIDSSFTTDEIDFFGAIPRDRDNVHEEGYAGNHRGHRRQRRRTRGVRRGDRPVPGRRTARHVGGRARRRVDQGVDRALHRDGEHPHLLPDLRLRLLVEQRGLPREPRVIDPRSHQRGADRSGRAALQRPVPGVDRPERPRRLQRRGHRLRHVAAERGLGRQGHGDRPRERLLGDHEGRRQAPVPLGHLGQEADRHPLPEDDPAAAGMDRRLQPACRVARLPRDPGRVDREPQHHQQPERPDPSRGLGERGRHRPPPVLRRGRFRQLGVDQGVLRGRR